MSTRRLCLCMPAFSVIILAAATPPGLAGDGVNQVPHPDACTWPGEGKACHRAQSAARIAQSGGGLLPRATPQDAPSEIDITHCHLDIEIDPSAKTIAGSNTVHALAGVDGLSGCVLDLRANMAVDSVLVNGVAAGFTRPDHQVAVSLDRAYNRGEGFQIVVYYHGTPQNISYSFSFDRHGSPSSPLIASLSQPWGAHTWWPCRENLTDKFTADIWITVPSGLVAASNGVLLGTDSLSGGRTRYRWHEGYPIVTYLVSVTATNYVKQVTSYDYPGGSMPVEFYLYPERASAIQPQLSHVVTMISTFSRPDVFGQYPFVNEKYGIAQFNWGGGMEHQTLSSQGAFDEWLTVHELAHQWWGDMITCRTWHDIWLNEGFATYSQALWEEKKPGGSMQLYRQMMQWVRPSYTSQAVYCYDIGSVDRIFDWTTSYAKSAWVLHMLRHVIGDAAFFETLAAYRAAFAGGFADTEDFRGVVESVSDRDLAWFFDQWVYRGGSPSYAYGWKPLKIGSQDWVSLYVRQTQTLYPPFKMPVDIRIKTPAGSKTSVVWNQAARQWYLLPADGPVSSVQLDPESWILQNGPSSTPYADGPPRLVGTEPAPGARLDAQASVSSVQIQFSEPVTCSTDDFAVTGSRTGTESFSLACSPSDYQATLTFERPLQAGQTWTVRVSDTVRSQAAQIALDGEMAAVASAYILPSGDGLPGGDAAFSFLLAARGDFDRDADVDAADLEVFAGCMTGPSVPGPPPEGCTPAQFSAADSDGDGDVDMADFGILQRCYAGRDAAYHPACFAPEE